MKQSQTDGHQPLYHTYNGLCGARELGKIKQFLLKEVHRSVRHLRKPGRPPVYYLSYLFRNQRVEKIGGRLGAIAEHSVNAHKTVFCDLRVGSYRYDNVSGGGLGDNSERDESLDYMLMPAEIESDAFRYGLWRLTDARYREAVEQYYERKSREVHFVDQGRKLAARVKRKGIKDYHPHHMPDIDTDYWKHLIRKAGNQVKPYGRIKNSWFEFVTYHRQNLFVDTEGAVILREQPTFELRGHFWLLSKKGDAVTQEINLIEGDEDLLPKENDFIRLVKEKIELLGQLERAPRLNSYSGPVLLSPDATGLFFHEVLGHRLEGSRLLSPEEGSTFSDLRGKRITPEYIDVIDDPTITKIAGRRPVGAFKYDDEGSPSARAVLVERGVLQNFLTTTTPIPGQKELNGHARNESHERPISRMGNLIVHNRSPVPFPLMWDLFLEEIRRQGRAFGIYIKETLGGETDTSSYDFQAFKGEVLSAVQVFPNGKTRPVRGVDFVGTPLTALDSVMCLGDDPVLVNNYCGAESGIIPVSVMAPSMLLRSLELQAKDAERYTQYALPLPYEKR
ncbi:MAG: TldD/PmbA family protein [Spirochaetia bacterium]|nr:TldD/PmbA family protein [Spirochaetia bacterium]